MREILPLFRSTWQRESDMNATSQRIRLLLSPCGRFKYDSGRFTARERASIKRSPYALPRGCQFRWPAGSLIQVPQSRQSFIRAHNQALPVSAMRVGHPYCSPVRIHG
jgi:hypothetical protein